jgi:hypothetical protein
MYDININSLINNAIAGTNNIPIINTINSSDSAHPKNPDIVDKIVATTNINLKAS